MKIPMPPIKTFLKPEFHTEYDFWKDSLFSQFVDTNQALFFLEKISSFPFGLLQLPYNQRTFWIFQYKFLINYSIVAIQRFITEDQPNNPKRPEKDVLTLPRFREAIEANMFDANAERLLQQQLQAANFEGQIAQIRENVNRVRNKHIAHLDKQLHTDPGNHKPVRTSLSELKQAFNIGFDLFNALDFNTSSDLYDPAYSEEKRKNRDTDIDHLLYETASHSEMLKLTPRNLQMIFRYQPRQAVVAFNEVLAAFGKPLIPLADSPEGE